MSDSGSGGRGGQGGSSYTYSTEKDGKTTQHINHGGRRGLDGRPGNRGASAPPGTNGPAGAFRITVADGTTSTNSTYRSPYNLHLQGVTLLSEKEDGVLEPGSRVFISSIKVLNTGGMPTPTSRSVLVYIKPEGIQQPTLNGKNWVISEGLDRFVQLPPALEPNNPVTVPYSSLTRGVDGITSAAVNSTGEYLAFRVAPINPVVALSSCSNRHERGAPFRVTTPLVIRAQMTPFGRDFTHFVRDMPFNISYPVHLSEVASLSALPPGGQTLVKFSITNSSLKSYGRDGELGREVMVKIAYEEGDVDPSQVTFTPVLDGISLDPIIFSPRTSMTAIFEEGRSIRRINLLPAGATVELTGWLSISQSAEPYTMAKFSVDLLLGEIDDPLKVVQIQRRDINVRVSKVYKKTPGSAILLVTNNQTTKAETEAWADLAISIFGNNPFGIIDIWDISQEGHFDLKRSLESGSTLCDDWKDATIIILDNHFDNFVTRASVSGTDDCVLNYLNHDELVGAMASHGVHFCVISPLLENSAAQRTHLSYPHKGIIFTSSQAHETLRALLDPFAATSSAFIVYGSSRDFVASEIDVHADGTPMTKKFTAPWSTKPIPPIHKISLETPTSQIPNSTPYTHLEHIVLVKRKKPFRSQEKVLELAENFQKQLLRKHPQRRYAFSVCTDADELQSLASQAQFGLPPRTQAAIRVRRSLDVSSLGSRIVLTATPASPVDPLAVARGAATIHTPAFIRSPQIVSAFLQSIPFTRRVATYAEALTTLDLSGFESDTFQADILRASILADLACEQAMLRLKKRNHGVTEGSIKLLLSHLTTFSMIELPPLPADRAGRKHLLDLLATFTAYMKTHLAWYQLLIPARRSRQITEISTVLINDLMSRVFPFGSSSKKQLKAASNGVRKQWKTDVARVRRFLKAIDATGQVVSLKGRAFAGVLGSVAGGKIEWHNEESNEATSIAGSVCTEFGILFTPESFLAGGSHGSNTIGVTSRSSLSSVTRHEHAIELSRSGTRRRDTISLRVSANRRATLDLASSPPIQGSSPTVEEGATQTTGPANTTGRGDSASLRGTICRQPTIAFASSPLSGDFSFITQNSEPTLDPSSSMDGRSLSMDGQSRSTDDTIASGVSVDSKGILKHSLLPIQELEGKELKSVDSDSVGDQPAGNDLH